MVDGGNLKHFWNLDSCLIVQTSHCTVMITVTRSSVNNSPLITCVTSLFKFPTMDIFYMIMNCTTQYYGIMVNISTDTDTLIYLLELELVIFLICNQKQIYSWSIWYWDRRNNRLTIICNNLCAVSTEGKWKENMKNIKLQHPILGPPTISVWWSKQIYYNDDKL